jgi:hypothetical protein
MSGSLSGGKNKEFSLQNVSGTSASTSRPIAPEGWEDAWRSVQSQLSPGGLTATQQQGADWLSSALRGGDAAGLNGIRSQLGDAASYWKDAADNRSSNTLATLASRYPEHYKPLQDVAAGTVGAQTIGSADVRAGDVTAAEATARDVAAQRGAQLMGAYQNPYMRDVVDASLADYDQNAAEARTALRAGNAGAFANKRTGVAEGQFAADSALGRGKLAADLRAGGFNTAAALGMQDADRALSADQSNQSAGLQAALANAGNRLVADQGNQSARLQAAISNAGNRLAADQFNAQQRLGADQFNVSNALTAKQFNNQMQNQREMFDVDAGYRGYEMRDNARRALESNLGAQAALGQQGFQMNADLANGLIGAGGVGQSQNLAWLGAGTPLFGEQSNGSQTATTNTNGRSSSKGGGISGIPLA